MSSSVSNQQVVDLFKKVYGDLHDLVPQDETIAREIPFSEGRRVGDAFIEAFTLSAETGWTIAGSGQEAWDINPAISGVVKQSSIIPSQCVLSSVIPFAFISRSAGGGERAFYDGTKHVMQNHIKSHGRLLETIRLYGRAPGLLGYVSYAPSGTVYRGATYSGSGNVTLTKADGSTIAFTAGVNTASKAILLAPGEFASGIWVGIEGAIVCQVDASLNVVGSGKLVQVDADLGILYVDFTPVAASSTTSHRLCFDGMQYQNEAVGMRAILGNTGSLFGISAASYSLWQSNVVDCGRKRWNLKALQVGVAKGVNRGGLEDPLLCLISPRTFAQMVNDEAAFRKYDASYKSASANNGFEAIEYYAANGVNTIMPHRRIKEGEAMGIVKSQWTRSGSAEIGFKIPGMDREVIFPLENQMGWVVRSYSDQYLLCQRPATQILWTNINDEGVAY